MNSNLDLLSLLKKAKQLQQHAYVPYSQFRVAAIVVLHNGQEISGVNVENAAYPVTICAERVALGQVFAQGYNQKDIKALFLITDSSDIGSPCGLCRQFMLETMLATCPLYISNKNLNNDIKSIFMTTVATLLPYPFIKTSLKGK